MTFSKGVFLRYDHLVQFSMKERILHIHLHSFQSLFATEAIKTHTNVIFVTKVNVSSQFKFAKNLELSIELYTSQLIHSVDSLPCKHVCKSCLHIFQFCNKVSNLVFKFSFQIQFSFRAISSSIAFLYYLFRDVSSYVVDSSTFSTSVALLLFFLTFIHIILIVHAASSLSQISSRQVGCVLLQKFNNVGTETQRYTSNQKWCRDLHC